MRLVVTGASSFVGAHFCRRAARHHDVFAIYHRTPMALSRVTPLRCDLRHSKAVERLRELSPDVVVHLAAKVMGASADGPVTDGAPNPAIALNRRMMDVLLALGEPIVYGSSTVVSWPVDSAYARCRREDEARLAQSGLPWVALRPCAPYGPRLVNHTPRHVESFHTLAGLALRAPVVPLPGGGKALRQPVHVDDFSDAALALIDRGLPGRALDAGGPEPISLAEIVHMIAALKGRRARILPVPTAALAWLSRFTPNLDEEMLEISDTDDVVDPEPLREASGVDPRPFKAGVRSLVL